MKKQIFMDSAVRVQMPGAVVSFEIRETADTWHRRFCLFQKITVGIF